MPRIENRVLRISENCHWVPRNRENRVPAGPYGVPNIFLKKPGFYQTLASSTNKPAGSRTQPCIVDSIGVTLLSGDALRPKKRVMGQEEED